MKNPQIHDGIRIESSTRQAADITSLKDSLCFVRSCWEDEYIRHDDGMIGPQLQIAGSATTKQEQFSMGHLFHPKPSMSCLGFRVASSRSTPRPQPCSKTCVTSRENFFLQVRAQQYSNQLRWHCFTFGNFR